MKRNDCILYCSGCGAAKYLKDFTQAAERQFREDSTIHQNHELPCSSGSIAGEDVERFFALMRQANHGENA